MAAKNIDPATGASTWAFGSHRWTKKMGNFTKKAIVKQIKSIPDHLLCVLILQHDIILKSALKNKTNIKISKGRDAIKV